MLNPLVLITKHQLLLAFCCSGLIYPTDPLHFFFLEYSENIREVVALIDGGGGILGDHYF